MQIPIAELQRIIERLFQHLEDYGIDSVEIPVDYYWNIPNDQIYKPYQDPSKIDMGQLSDDWSELQKIIHLDREPVGYDFVLLASIIRAIGEHSIA